MSVSDLTLSQAAQQLWNLDTNRLTPHQDYEIDVQQGKKPFWKEDCAHGPLFTFVNPDVFSTTQQQRPTYQSFLALLDNYSAHVGTDEVVSDVEREEMQRFLQLVLETAPMQYCHQYCHAHRPDLVPADVTGFQQLLHNIWFDMYGRRGRSGGGGLDSSGFEHVFVGEVRDGEVSGLHNWIQFYLEEKAGRVDYRGYLKPRSQSDAATDSNDHILTIQFSWGGVEKFAGTMFVGVSPEFELALYTMCFLVGGEENDIELDTGNEVFGLRIKCYRMGKDKIGTTYPEVTSHYEE